MIACPDRADPINGTSIQLAANLVDFSCDPGFNLNDSILEISLCEPTTGLWSGPVPSCISKCACRAVYLSLSMLFVDNYRSIVVTGILYTAVPVDKT